jgi:CRP/FNR family transcriptional regulator, anaerobic regulatory protein
MHVKHVLGDGKRMDLLAATNVQIRHIGRHLVRSRIAICRQPSGPFGCHRIFKNSAIATVSLGFLLIWPTSPSSDNPAARRMEGPDMVARRLVHRPGIVVGINPRPASTFEQNLAQSWLRRVAAKGIVFSEGDPATYIYRIETGAVALYKVAADGRRQILGFAYPGDFLGLGAPGEHLMNAQAIKPTRLRCLPVAAIRQSADPSIGFKLYEALAGELAATRNLVLTIGRRSAIERVVGFLLAFSRRNGESGLSGCCFDLPMTRGDIGDLLGLSVETVSRTFTMLKLHGLIELPRADRVRFIDIEQLQNLADGDRPS